MLLRRGGGLGFGGVLGGKGVDDVLGWGRLVDGAVRTVAGFVAGREVIPVLVVLNGCGQVGGGDAGRRGLDRCDGG